MTEHSKEVMDRRREGFEDWYSQSWDCDDQLQSVIVFMRDERGQYVYGPVHESFMVWNAALDSVVIELPEKFGDDHGGDSHHASIHDDAVDEFRLAIESTGLGLRVKA